MVSYIEKHLTTFKPDNAEDIAFWKSRLEGGAQKITGAAVMETGSTVVELPAGQALVHRVHFLRRWGWAAASVILLTGIGAYLWTRSAKEAYTAHQHSCAPEHIAPGKSGAVLTLADGSLVILDSLGNGVVADQSGAQVVLQDGKLAYKPLRRNADAPLTFNTMTTPRRRQFQVTLPTAQGYGSMQEVRSPTLPHLPEKNGAWQ